MMTGNSFTFTAEQIEHAVKNNRLLSLEIEPTIVCNYGCLYCYANAGPHPPQSGELSFEQLCNVIMQAKELGAKQITILGGEPLIYARISDLIDHIDTAGLAVEVFTNGSLLTEEFAQQMVAISGRTVVKLHSQDAQEHNTLCGQKNAFKNSMRAINLLEDAGAAEKSLLAIGCAITSANKNNILCHWQWCRENGFEPYFETLTPQGRSLQNQELMLSPLEIKDLFKQLSEYDAERSIYWQPHPPLVASSCLRHRYSCLVTSTGEIQPCVGITESVGNIQEDKLMDILENSEIFDNLKHHRSRLKGHCGNCENGDDCYGCRGGAYQVTGDYLAPDPSCWHNCGEEAPQSLPMPVDGLVPHRKPMLLIDRLVEFGDRCGVCESQIHEDNIWVTSEGNLSEAAYVELAAQTTAAVEAFMRNGKEIKGALVGVKRFTVTGRSGVGDTLRTEIHKRYRLDKFAIIDARITKQNEIIAEGEIKIWQNTS